ncbi:MAG: flotillin family protein [Spartobacteria bacterium]|nr:flotillin family protein [Spartobacteria bacterium]
MVAGIVGLIVIGVLFVLVMGMLAMLVKCYHKVHQGSAIIRNGWGGRKVSFAGIFVLPIIHHRELMDISVKRIEIDRTGSEGLVCQDNMRADVKVAFFVRVNETAEDVLRVAQSLGCERGSSPQALIEFFDAKFSEALKTVGKKFDFVELYTNRDTFKEEILKVIGTDLNGYVLDDAAIDYLEQTNLDKMDPNNILDAEGIKKIVDLTAKQAVLANNIAREKEKTIKKQDVEAREAILQLERQQVDAEQKQGREIAEVTAREQAEAKKVEAEELLKSERARIATAEEVAIAEENKDRQIIVAKKSKERTEAVEQERVIKDRDLEATERERVVTLAQIEKEKAVEVEKKNMQEVVRERVAVERTVVEEEEKIKDTHEFATADRSKQVAITKAQEDAEQILIKQTKAAEAQRDASKFGAEQVVIEAQAQRDASEREAEARKILADAKAEEEAVIGVGEARALEAKATATEQFGLAEARVIEKKANADANGIRDKAEAMKLFDSVGKEHEEFKLRLNKDLEIELAAIRVEQEIAKEQSAIVGEALKSAHIDIVGGESEFFDKIVNAVTRGKVVDRIVDNSRVLTDITDTFFSGDAAQFKEQLARFVSQFGMGSEDVKNLTLSALLAKMTAQTDNERTQALLEKAAQAAAKLGLSDKLASSILKK